jgi:hypothetical protein
MKTSILIRFGVVAVLISAGCALLLADNYRGGILFGVATVFFMPRSELTQPIPRRELWAMFGILFILVAASVAAKYFLPSSAADVIRRIICHPLFIVLLWLLMMWGLFHHYQRQRRGIDGAGNAGLPC